MTAASDQYEREVGEIARAVFRMRKNNDGSVSAGRCNRWRGESGYSHQIDVSVIGCDSILLVECKCWRRPIDVGHVLQFAARLIDVRPTRTEAIHGVMATTQTVQKGATIVAAHFGIDLAVVKSGREFVFKYQRLVGMGAAVKAKSSMTAKLGRNPADLEQA